MTGQHMGLSEEPGSIMRKKHSSSPPSGISGGVLAEADTSGVQRPKAHSSTSLLTRIKREPATTTTQPPSVAPSDRTDLAEALKSEPGDFIETNCHWRECSLEFPTQDDLVKVCTTILTISYYNYNLKLYLIIYLFSFSISTLITFMQVRNHLCAVGMAVHGKRNRSKHNIC